jgi:hypothetical protein
MLTNETVENRRGFVGYSLGLQGTLNGELLDREAEVQPGVGPGLPPSIVSASWLITEDRLTGMLASR